MQVLFQILLFFAPSIFCSQPTSQETQLVVRSATSDHARSVTIAQNFISQAQCKEMQNVINLSELAINKSNHQLQTLQAQREIHRNNVRNIARDTYNFKRQQSGDVMFDAAQQKINDLRKQPDFDQWKYLENYRYQLQQDIEVAKNRSANAAICGFKESYDPTKEKLYEKLTSPQELFDHLEGKLAEDKVACKKKMSKDFRWNNYCNNHWDNIFESAKNALLKEDKALQCLRNEEKILSSDNVEYQKILDNMHGLLQKAKLQQEENEKLKLEAQLQENKALQDLKELEKISGTEQAQRLLITDLHAELAKTFLAAHLTKPVIDWHKRRQAKKNVAALRQQKKIKVQKEKKEQCLELAKMQTEESYTKFVIEQEKKLMEKIAQEKKEKAEKLSQEEKRLDAEGVRAEERAKKEREQQAQMLIAAQKAEDEILQAAERDRLLKIEQLEQKIKAQRVAVIKELKFTQEQKRAEKNKKEKLQAKKQVEALAYQRKQEEKEKKKQADIQADNKRLEAVAELVAKKEAEALAYQRKQEEQRKADISAKIEKEKERIAKLEASIAEVDRENRAEAHEIEQALNGIISADSGGQLSISNLSIIQFRKPAESKQQKKSNAIVSVNEIKNVQKQKKTSVVASSPAKVIDTLTHNEASNTIPSATMQDMLNSVQQDLGNGTTYENFCLKVGQEVLERTRYVEQLNNNKKLTDAVRQQKLEEYDKSNPRFSIEFALQQYADKVKDESFINDNTLLYLQRLRDRIIQYGKLCVLEGKGEKISMYASLEDSNKKSSDRYQQLHEELQDETAENIINSQVNFVKAHERERFNLTVLRATLKNLEKQTETDQVLIEKRNCLDAIDSKAKEVEACKENAEKYSLKYKRFCLYEEMEKLYGVGGILDTSVLIPANLTILKQRVLSPEILDKECKKIENMMLPLVKQNISLQDEKLTHILNLTIGPSLSHILSYIGLTDKSAHEWMIKILNSAQIFAIGYANDEVDLDTLHYHLCKKNMLINAQDKTNYSQAQINDVANIQMHFVRCFARLFHGKI